MALADPRITRLHCIRRRGRDSYFVPPRDRALLNGGTLCAGWLLAQPALATSLKVMLASETGAAATFSAGLKDGPIRFGPFPSICTRCTGVKATQTSGGLQVHQGTGDRCKGPRVQRGPYGTHRGRKRPTRFPVIVLQRSSRETKQRSRRMMRLRDRDAEAFISSPHWVMPATRLLIPRSGTRGHPSPTPRAGTKNSTATQRGHPGVWTAQGRREATAYLAACSGLLRAGSGRHSTGAGQAMPSCTVFS